MFNRQPHMVPRLECSAAPSALTRFAMTTLSIDGAAPSVTVQKRYPPVASAVTSSAPSKRSIGTLKKVNTTENNSPQKIEHQKPNDELLYTVS